MMRRFRSGFIVVWWLTGLLPSPAVLGTEGTARWKEHNSVYGQARQAVERGEAMPLLKLKECLQRVAPGQVVAVHYEFEFGRWVYEFKVIDPKGQLRKVHIDANNGELVRIADY
ncbi:MAG: PepSY domain-containing protein [Gammaproteobacteria bacterium]|nr:PepSY domain-containing protein [Gammaproteobacteria bacterium]MBU1654364.1 PepSY domain-containing protein [Gammaproteobacteria bacterium]MBU1961991.1 PepSY domain-containing protein [Gammaproteobacteria bacterium]